MAKKKVVRRCSKCRRTGHYQSTCKNKRKKKTIKRSSKKKTKKKVKKKTKRKTKKKAKKKSGKRRPATMKAWKSLKKRKVFRFVGATRKGNLSAKDWGIGMTGDGLGVATWWGKIWGNKTLKPNRFSSKAAAKAHYDKKIAEKRRKGYVQIANRKRRRRIRRHQRRK